MMPERDSPLRSCQDDLSRHTKQLLHLGFCINQVNQFDPLIWFDDEADHRPHGVAYDEAGAMKPMDEEDFSQSHCMDADDVNE